MTCHVAVAEDSRLRLFTFAFCGLSLSLPVFSFLRVVPFKAATEATGHLGSF